MKITKTNKDAMAKKMRKEIANQGCDVCPCCGEHIDEIHYMKDGIFDKGIQSGILCTNYVKGFFNMKHMQIDHYSCNTCGAEWESEPYEV